ncbi:MAG: SDR family NAD(P)-dependent oxidoreductase [Catalinimonas sp.]
MELSGKVALVTGASKGIGLATVQTLLGAGMKVGGLSRSQPLVRHPDFYFCPTDMRQIESVTNGHQRTVEHFGAEVSVLINSAGLGYEGPLADMPWEQWQEMFDVNVNGLFYATRRVIPGMREMGEGHVVMLSSVAGTTGVPNMAGYCGTKHAVRGIAHALFKEVRHWGIKVTTLYPGSVQTNFFDQIDSVEAHEQMLQPEDLAQTILHLLQSPPNYLPLDLEVRPLNPKK